MADEMKRWSLQSKGGDWHRCIHDRPTHDMRRTAERIARRKMKRQTRQLAEEASREDVMDGYKVYVCDAPRDGCGNGRRRARALPAAPEGSKKSCPFCGSEMREASPRAAARALADLFAARALR